MRAVGVLLTAVVGLVGCVLDDESSCGPWAEEYEFHFESQGTRLPYLPCGDVPDTVGSAEGLGGVGRECRGESRLEKCEIFVQETCCPEDEDVCATFGADISQVDGPARLEGVMTIVVRWKDTGDILCLETYDVTATAL